MASTGKRHAFPHHFKPDLCMGANADFRIWDLPRVIRVRSLRCAAASSLALSSTSVSVHHVSQFMGVTYLNADGQLNALELQNTGSPYKYGIHSLEQLVKTCLPKGLVAYKSPAARL